MAEDNAQKKKYQNGGARPGAGRPKGSKNKLRVSDFYNGEERDLLIQQWKDQTIYADNPDKQLFLELIHQLFGKATQKTIQEDEDGNNIIPLMVKFIEHGNGNPDRV